MQFYPSGETITCRLLDLPLQHTEWIITGAEAGEVIAAGFRQRAQDDTGFIHPESGDTYQLARHQYFDEVSGRLKFHCDPGVTLENELATRALTILAMASDGDDIIDPFDGQEDLVAGLLRHVTSEFAYIPRNLLTTAIWAAKLRIWGFRVAHGTFKLMKKMVASGALEQIPQEAISDAALQALASPRPSEFFRVLHRCGALAVFSGGLAGLFEKCDHPHSENGLPGVMRSLDRAAAETENVSTVIKRFYQLLGDRADSIFNDLGLAALLENCVNNGD